MKKILLILLALLPVALMAAESSFKDVNNIVSDGVASAQQAGGGGLYTFLGWFPIVATLSIAVAGLLYGINENKQQQKGGMKIVSYGLGGVLGGVVLGIVVNMLIGAFVFQSPTKGYSVFSTYWKKGVEQSAGTDVFNYQK